MNNLSKEEILEAVISGINAGALKAAPMAKNMNGTHAVLAFAEGLTKAFEEVKRGTWAS